MDRMSTRKKVAPLAPLAVPATGGYLLTRFNVAADFDFQKRIAQALYEVAVQVYGETPQPANHAARAAYALQVIGDPALRLVFDGTVIGPHPRAMAVAQVLVAQGNDATTPDATLVTAVAAMWNPLAGA